MPFLMVLGLAGALILSPVAPTAAACSGRVVEAANRTPIAGAQVTLFRVRFPPNPGPSAVPSRPPTAITDQNGQYAFDGLDAGQYRVSAQKAGFTPLNGPQSVALEVSAGGGCGAVDVMLQKGAVIVGRVLDQAGEPMTDARVMAMRRPPIPSSASGANLDRLLPAGSGAQTNDLGEFRLYSLPPGEYYVQASPRSDFAASSASRTTTIVPTYFPSAPDPAAAQPVSVGAGQTSGDVVIRMIVTSAFQVSGVVLDEAGRPVSNAMVRLMPDRPGGTPMVIMGGPWSQSRSDASGKFVLNNVTNGAYTLLAVPPVVTSGAAGVRGGAGGGGFSWSGTSTGTTRGSVGGGVATETINGVTTLFRDDTATRAPLTINEASVSGLEMIVRLPAR